MQSFTRFCPISSAPRSNVRDSRGVKFVIVLSVTTVMVMQLEEKYDSSKLEGPTGELKGTDVELSNISYKLI